MLEPLGGGAVMHLIDPLALARQRHQELIESARAAGRSGRARALFSALWRRRTIERDGAIRGRSPRASSDVSHDTSSMTSGPPGVADVNKVLANRLYDALRRHEIDVLNDTIAPDFVGHIPLGMPGRSATVRSRRRVLQTVRAASRHGSNALPVPDRILSAEGDFVVVIGRYTRPDDPPSHVPPSFTHLIQITGDQVSSLREVTM